MVSDDILFDLLTVREQLEFHCIARGYGEEKDEICDDLLQSVSLSNDEPSLCQNLSGGMKRRLSIACAFLGQTKLVLLGSLLPTNRIELNGDESRFLDEPSSGLDPINRRLLW